MSTCSYNIMPVFSVMVKCQINVSIFNPGTRYPVMTTQTSARRLVNGQSLNKANKKIFP